MIGIRSVYATNVVRAALKAKRDERRYRQITKSTLSAHSASRKSKVIFSSDRGVSHSLSRSKAATAMARGEQKKGQLGTNVRESSRPDGYMQADWIKT